MAGFFDYLRMAMGWISRPGTPVLFPVTLTNVHVRAEVVSLAEVGADILTKAGVGAVLVSEINE